MRKFLFLVIFCVFFVSFAAAGDEPLIGNLAPSLKLNDLSGDAVDLSAYLGKKPVIISFFASWCESSVSELKYLSTLFNTYKKDGLKVFAISYDREADEVEKIAQENDIPFRILMDKKLASLNTYRILIIPSVVVIDADGKITNLFVEFDENVEKAIEKDVKAILQ